MLKTESDEGRLKISSNCIFHPVGQKYQNSNQAVRMLFSVVGFLNPTFQILP